MTNKVTVQPSKHFFNVDDGETVLDAALRQGLAFPYGCRNGECGSCKGKLLAGAVHYEQGRPSGLSETDAQNGYALFCQARPSEDLIVEVHEIGGISEIPVKTLPCRISTLEHLSHDVVRLQLKLPATERLQFFAGQYLDFLLKDGRRRSFSIANAPHDDAYIELHIRHIDGGRFTTEVFESMHEKDILRIQGPLGSFFLRETSDRPIIMMAGGTGFAPLKGMIEHALAMKLNRSIHLYWGARSRQDLYLDSLAHSWADQHDNIRYTPVLSDAKPEDDWHGRTGYVHEAVLEDYPDLSAVEVYASGPPAMVYAGRDAFVERGLDAEHYFSDAFEFAND
jgi:CDP-4-dehydro-6-deoxyglucose reductase